MRWLGFIVLCLILLAAAPVWGHANLQRASPAPNATSAQPPAEIRLWFTEPLEAEFSYITLRDSSGALVDTPASQVAANDATQMFIVPGALANGVYTVTWRVVSSADGHQTQGSFPIIIGLNQSEPLGGIGSIGQEPAPLDAALVRWLNFMAMSLTVGGIAFWLFVWSPVLPNSIPAVEKRMNRLIILGWLLLGLSGVLLLLLQVASAANIPPVTALFDPALGRVLSMTRSGQLWLARMLVWLVLGAALWFGRRRTALAAALLTLLTTSLYSHASAASDVFASVAADWLHLSAAALWVGGLVQFFNVLNPLRRQQPATAPLTLGLLVGYFSLLARVAVAALVVTGLYAAWLHVGSVAGLLQTVYGQTLLVKGLLMLPLLVIAVINLFLTYGGLRAEKAQWMARLRGLLSAEIALTAGMLAATALMTSIAPARTVIDSRLLAAKSEAHQPFYDSYFKDDLHIDLEITEGYVGQNTFTVYIYTHEGLPVEDVSLIRLRFENQTQNLGTSELRPTHQGGGVYSASGANLSAPGQWRIRATVQRPGHFDIVTDFLPLVEAAPAALSPTPALESTPLLPDRVLVLLLTGAAALGIGGYFVGESSLHFKKGDQLVSTRRAPAGLLLAAWLVFIGLAFTVSGVQAMQPAAEPQAANGSPRPAALYPSYKSTLPYLLDDAGNILRPDESGTWRTIGQPGRIHDLWIDPTGAIWAAGDAGFMVNFMKADSADWQMIDPLPALRVMQVHGYMLALRQDGTAARLPGGARVETRYLLYTQIPQPDQPAGQMVMLSNHQFVLQNGSALFLTPDEGLTWHALPAEHTPSLITTDTAGHLIAISTGGLQQWHYETQRWRDILPLPDGQIISAAQVFDERLYALAGGALYREAGGGWQRLNFSDTNLRQMAYQYPSTLWLLDEQGRALWMTTDGDHWTGIPIIISADSA